MSRLSWSTRKASRIRPLDNRGIFSLLPPTYAHTLLENVPAFVVLGFLPVTLLPFVAATLKVPREQSSFLCCTSRIEFSFLTLYCTWYVPKPKTSHKEGGQSFGDRLVKHEIESVGKRLVSNATNNSNPQNERSEVITREFHTEHNQVRAAGSRRSERLWRSFFPLSCKAFFSDSRQV